MAIDINYASAEEIAELGGISHELAEQIVAYRDESGGFTSLEELAEIPGCDEQLVLRLREAGANVGAAADIDGAA